MQVMTNDKSQLFVYPIVWWTTVLPFMPDETVAAITSGVCDRIREPRVILTGVIQHQIQNDFQTLKRNDLSEMFPLRQKMYFTFLFGGCRQVFKILQLAKCRVNGNKEIFDILAVEGVFIGSLENGWNGDHVDTQVHKVIQASHNSYETKD